MRWLLSVVAAICTAFVALPASAAFDQGSIDALGNYVGDAASSSPSAPWEDVGRKECKWQQCYLCWKTVHYLNATRALSVPSDALASATHLTCSWLAHRRNSSTCGLLTAHVPAIVANLTAGHSTHDVCRALHLCRHATASSAAAQKPRRRPCPWKTCVHCWWGVKYVNATQRIAGLPEKAVEVGVRVTCPHRPRHGKDCRALAAQVPTMLKALNAGATCAKRICQDLKRCKKRRTSPLDTEEDLDELEDDASQDEDELLDVPRRRRYGARDSEDDDGEASWFGDEELESGSHRHCGPRHPHHCHWRHHPHRHHCHRHHCHRHCPHHHRHHHRHHCHDHHRDHHEEEDDEDSWYGDEGHEALERVSCGRHCGHHGNAHHRCHHHHCHHHDRRCHCHRHGHHARRRDRDWSYDDRDDIDDESYDDESYDDVDQGVEGEYDSYGHHRPCHRRRRHHRPCHIHHHHHHHGPHDEDVASTPPRKAMVFGVRRSLWLRAAAALSTVAAGVVALGSLFMLVKVIKRARAQTGLGGEYVAVPTQD